MFHPASVFVCLHCVGLESAINSFSFILKNRIRKSFLERFLRLTRLGVAWHRLMVRLGFTASISWCRNWSWWCSQTPAPSPTLLRVRRMQCCHSSRRHDRKLFFFLFPSQPNAFRPRWRPTCLAPASTSRTSATRRRRPTWTSTAPRKRSSSPWRASSSKPSAPRATTRSAAVIVFFSISRFLGYNSFPVRLRTIRSIHQVEPASF